MENSKIKVYAKLDENRVIIEIKSEIFLNDTTGYICIDMGYGDKYSHAQGNYLEKGLTDEKGRYNYKFISKKVMELTEEEKATFYPEPTPQPTTAERLEALESAMLEMILGGM